MVPYICTKLRWLCSYLVPMLAKPMLHVPQQFRTYLLQTLVNEISLTIVCAEFVNR